MPAKRRGGTVEDELAILKVLGRYSHIIDNQRWNDLHEIFTDDAEFHVVNSNATMVGWRGIAERFSTIVHPLGHHFTNPVVDVAADGKTAKSLIKLLVVRANGLTGTGEYEDELVLTRKGWRISRRIARVRTAEPAPAMQPAPLHAKRPRRTRP